MACWGGGGYRASPEGDGEMAQKGHETPGKEKLLSVLFNSEISLCPWHLERSDLGTLALHSPSCSFPDRRLARGSTC